MGVANKIYKCPTYVITPNFKSGQAVMEGLGDIWDCRGALYIGGPMPGMRPHTFIFLRCQI
jgi:hypothetical protein